MGTKTIALFVVVLTTMMCGAQSQSTNTVTEKCEAPSDAAAKPNPESEKAEARTTGRKMFIRTCARCHEEDGSGRSQGAANLRCPQVQSQTDGALFWKISNGNTKAGMPPFDSLPEDRRWDIVTFLRTLKDPKCDNSKTSKGETSQGDAKASGTEDKKPQ
jgi:mono/diheme cytochrome c family protein